MAFRSQQCGQPPRAEKRTRGEQLVDLPHQRQIVVIGGAPRPIQAGARNSKQRAPAADRQRIVLAADELTSVRGAHLPDLLAKKSRSTMSWPILACNRSISRSCSAAPSPLPLSNARAA